MLLKGPHVRLWAVLILQLNLFLLQLYYLPQPTIPHGIGTQQPAARSELLEHLQASPLPATSCAKPPRLLVMAPVGSPPRFAQLEQAALHVLRLIGDTPRLEETRLAVIGDLALCQYLPEEHGNVTVS